MKTKRDMSHVQFGLDKRLEAAIDECGRERVYARASGLGWGAADSVPKFVWWGIVTDLAQKEFKHLS